MEANQNFGILNDEQSDKALESDATMPEWLTNFIAVYQQLNATNLTLLKSIYHQNVMFIDPLHQISGLDALTRYFESMYMNVSECQFVIEEYLDNGQQAALYWTMTFKHKKLNRGKAISVKGHSKLSVKNNLVIYHQDYFDVGAMLYEHVPLLGRLIKVLKQRVKQ